MQPIEPTGLPSNRYPLLGFLLILGIFIGLGYAVINGAIAIGALEQWQTLIFLVGVPFAVYARIMWNRSESFRQKHDAVVQSPKTIGLMTGVSYFFIGIIVVAFVIPLLFALVFWIRGNF